MLQWETCEGREAEESFGNKKKKRETARVRTQELSKNQLKGGVFRSSERKSSGRKKRKIRNKRSTEEGFGGKSAKKESQASSQ